ncbi:MAG: ABC transporter permease subunit [Planctomycetaceae bacterium]
MPIHNLGYREWSGELESGSSRWSVVAGIGIRRAWQSMWVRRLALMVWVAPLAYGILIFVFEQFLSNNTQMSPRDFSQLLKMLLPAEAFPAVAMTLEGLNTVSHASPEAYQELLAAARPLFWKGVMLQLQRSQCIGMVILVGLIAPQMISQDVRSRAFLLYFSRPLTRTQYIFGKFATVASFLLLTCTLPQLVLYAFAVLLSPDISVVVHTWDIPVRTLLASAVMIIPTALLALMLSSLTVETRFATFGWFAIWIFGMAAYVVMRSLNGDTSEIILRTGFLYLLYNDASLKILDLPTLTSHFDTQMTFLVSLAVVSFAVIFRKVSAPLRA